MLKKLEKSVKIIENNQLYLYIYDILPIFDQSCKKRELKTVHGMFSRKNKNYKSRFLLANQIFFDQQELIKGTHLK